MNTPQFSSRLKDLRTSPIREILSVLDRPGMISFAGGLPATDSFPTFDTCVPPATLQYGATEGDRALRERIGGDLAAMGLKVSANQILILSGSQQGIDLVAKLFIDPGTLVALESPTYLAALQVFRFFGARFAPFEPRQCEDRDLFQERPAFAYVIPTFQNPTGYCYSGREREALAQACERRGVPLFEDDPYRNLAYDSCERTPICASLKKNPWIYQGSFSKTLAPGLRLGFLAASPTLVPHLVRLKQAADLHSSRVSQWLVLDALERPGRQARQTALVDAYRRKRDAFARSLGEHFADCASWERPSGGLFFWLKLKQPVDTRRLLETALSRGVAFMPGEPFYATARPHTGMLRLAFSHASETAAHQGLRILAELVRESRG
ncbi:MAG: aminotransferase-like domain-containing protein [Acidiferrobacter sp.]